MKENENMYVVIDEITDLGSIVTPDFEYAKKYAKSLVSNYKNEILRHSKDKPNPILIAMPEHYRNMKADKIKSLSKNCYHSYNGRKAEVEIVTFKKGNK